MKRLIRASRTSGLEQDVNELTWKLVKFRDSLYTVIQDYETKDDAQSTVDALNEAQGLINKALDIIKSC